MLGQNSLLALAALLRVVFFLFGLYQDATMVVPYTDIDYLVFTDAAQYVAHGLSPYLRETYRYTPLLSWIVLPSATLWYSFGKFLFIVCDLLTGWIVLQLLNRLKPGLEPWKKLALSSLWLMNPMVITISTRGSSESVLCVFVMTFVLLLLRGETVLSGVFAGLSVHFKVYPIIYLPTAMLYLSSYSTPLSFIKNPLVALNAKSLKFAISALTTFITLGFIMYRKYGYEFLEHSYIYHLSRTDHRHNFSVYNVSLYFTSSEISSTGLDFTKLAFLPQLIISGVLIPIIFSKRDVVKALFLQTFTFVIFNKVITSQYFIWFLIFLPIYLSDSKFLTTKKINGVVCLLLWIVSQGLWLFNGYQLEFLGKEVFYPGLLQSSVFFFFCNVYILGQLIDDV
jgi:phosphatidylinositol glycan class M